MSDLADLSQPPPSPQSASSPSDEDEDPKEKAPKRRDDNEDDQVADQALVASDEVPADLGNAHPPPSDQKLPLERKLGKEGIVPSVDSKTYFQG